jgi:hypothetical protein
MSERIITTFPQVDHDTASAEVRALFDDIHGTLRLPWVAFAIRVMMQFPAFVPAAWSAIRAPIATRYAERAADAIRRAAILPGPAPADPRPALLAGGWTPERIALLGRTLDALNYGNPKYLLLITAWNEAWNGRDAGGRGAVLSGQDADVLPFGLPAGVTRFHLVDPDRASPDVQRSLARVRDAFLHHGPASDYRVLAQWPDYLSIAVDSLVPVARTPEFDATAARLRAIAREAVAGFATNAGITRVELAAQMTPTEIAGITGLLFLYNRFIADITISIVRLQQAFAGSDHATRNPFPI